MQISLDTSKWYDRIWAAFLFFTRLPLWRLYQPPQTAYKTVVEHWPLTGWLTAGVMAAVLYFGCYLLPYEIAVLAAIAARLLLTGALHEDGLADFMDGFGGGGHDRQRILDIMKDSHIGTYGVIGLILYFALLLFSLCSLTPADAALTVLAVDPFAKMLSAQMVLLMPYARTADTAKNRVVYRKPSMAACVGLAVQGLLPLGAYIYYMYARVDWQMLVFLPCLTMFFLQRLMWSRLRGYTGDCCGAMFLLVELTGYLAVVVCMA